jgi:aminomethyltransferase
VVNASNREHAYAWLKEREIRGSDVRDVSEDCALLAVQGPRAIERLGLPPARPFTFAEASIDGVEVMVNRTGYTGEDGCELLCMSEDAVRLWDAVLERGAVPCGLGARDTLRLEAAMRLYGNDIDTTTSVLEADLEWILSWTKGAFIGREALERQKTAGLSRRLVGFEMVDRAIARHGHPVLVDGEPAGVVTSGTQTPFLKKAIGMAYVPVATPVDAEIEIDIRGRRAKARVVPLPFYKRPRK